MERRPDNFYIEKLLKGETDCFAPIVEKYSKQVFSLIVRIVGNREDAEELTQDAFLKVYKSLKSFRGDSSFSTWLYRIAYNIAISAERKQKNAFIHLDEAVIPDMEDEESDFDADTTDETLTDRLRRALEQLAPDDRAMITLFYMHNKSMQEIAVITGLTETNVKTRIFRLRKRLKILIEKKI